MAPLQGIWLYQGFLRPGSGITEIFRQLFLIVNLFGWIFNNMLTTLF